MYYLAISTSLRSMADRRDQACDQAGGAKSAKIEFASLAESGGDFAERARIKRLAEGAALEESS